MIRFLVKVVHFLYYILNAFKFRNGFGTFRLCLLYQTFTQNISAVLFPLQIRAITMMLRISVLMIRLGRYI